MSKQRYTEEFKAEAVKQITVRGHRLAQVVQRLGVSHAPPVPVDQGTPETRWGDSGAVVAIRRAAPPESRAQACDRGARHL
jgi:transposase-like protein